jgi:hypothetical protein
LTVSTTATDSAFYLIYPHGLDLGPGFSALDACGIPHRASRFPYAPEEPAPAALVYLMDEAHLLALGSRETVEHALELIARAQPATTVVLARRGSEAAWLAENPHVGGWLVAPVDGPALVATVRAAAASIPPC